MSRGLRVLPDPAALAGAAAEEIAAALQAAVAQNGRVSIALSGGTTPLAIYRRLAARADVPWPSVHLFWGDERCVPPDHPDSNYGRARQALLAHVSIPADHVHRIAGEIEPTAAADLYEEALETWAPRLDLVLLGLGADGHVASLFPGTAALAEQRRRVAANWVPQLDAHRVTLTFPALNAARRILFMVAGADKAAALAATLRPEADGTLASRVQPLDGDVLWLVEERAAALLGSRHP